jgi:ribosome maturation factor RimP
MSEEETIARIEETVLPVLRDHGVELVELEWRAHGRRGLLRVFIDRAGGVGTDDCERVSRELGHVLDAGDVIAGGYDLQVSSPGLDRTLRSERELRWAKGKRVRCWLAEGRELPGQLAGFDPDRLVLEDETGVRHVLPRGEVRRIRLDPELPWARRT